MSLAGSYFSSESAPRLSLGFFVFYAGTDTCAPEIMKVKSSMSRLRPAAICRVGLYVLGGHCAYKQNWIRHSRRGNHC